jgi:hypothetical protein
VTSKFGASVEWHADLAEVPRDRFTFFVANEFFDALPVHKFVRVHDDAGKVTGNDAGSDAGNAAGVWREVLVDVCDDGHLDGPPRLRFVRARNKTPGEIIFKTLLWPIVLIKYRDSIKMFSLKTLHLDGI